MSRTGVRKSKAALISAVMNLYIRSGRNGEMYPVEQGTEAFDAIIDS